jgi:hypothetical protein
MSKTPRQNREIERQFLIAIKRATTWHLLLAIFLLLRQHAKLSARSLRPVDLLIPVAFFQMLIFV